MRRTLLLAAPIVLAVGAWQLLERYEIEQGAGGFRLRAKHSAAVEAAPLSPARTTLRVASLNLLPLDEQKLARPQVAKVLAELFGRFDIIALQGIQAADDIIGPLVAMTNAGGTRYQYVLGPHVGVLPRTEQFAFVYNAEAVELDRESMYTVEDPDELLTFDPLVVACRPAGLAAARASTFTLVNVQVDPARVDAELPALGRVYRAVRDDGRGEDDVLLLGSFAADPEKLAHASGIPYFGAAIAGLPTTTRRRQSLDNLLFDRRTSAEFANSAGVVDVQKQFGLSMAEALELGEHLPVWADFYTCEGGAAAAGVELR